MDKENIYQKLTSHKDLISSHNIKRYFNFIMSCIETYSGDCNEEVYENHHILPASLFPEYESLTHHKWNKARLTIEQHVLAHYILAKSYGGRMWSSLALLSGRCPNKRLSYIAKARKEQSIFLNTINPESGLKTSNTLSTRIDKETGLIVSYSRALKSSITMKNTIINGMTIYEHSFLKAKRTKSKWSDEYKKEIFNKAIQTKRENGTIACKDKINTALNINLYDCNGDLIKNCNGEFYTYINEIGAPKALRETYIHNTKYEYDFVLKDNILEKITYEGWYIRKENDLFVMFNDNNENVGKDKVAQNLIKRFTQSNGVNQSFMKTYRNNTCIKVPDSKKQYLNYEKFNNWYARIVV